AGGCRLAFDLARRLSPELLVATEINPLLFLVAKRVLAGERVSLWEFSPLPIDVERCQRLQVLAAPEVRTDIQLVFQDFLESSFNDATFDLVVTPWFIDVVGAPMASIVSRVNKLLRPGGLWVNFGPLMFKTPQRSSLLTHDEVLELARQHGFAVEGHFLPQV